MKTASYLFLLFWCVFSQNALARQLGPDSSWDEILLGNVRVEIPRILMKSTYVPVLNLCLSGDNLRTRADIEASGSSARAGSRLFTPRLYSEERCVFPSGSDSAGGACERTQTFMGAHPLRYDVPVYSMDNGDMGRELLFEKPFEIPACAK